MTTAPPTWANTLNPDNGSLLTDITTFHRHAVELGYPYAAWNGWVFRTDDFATGTADARVCRASDLDDQVLDGGTMTLLNAVVDSTLAVIHLSADHRRRISGARDRLLLALRAHRATNEKVRA